jgi:hypothetical protein
LKTFVFAAACLLGLYRPAQAEECARPQLLNTVPLERLNDQGLVGVPVILNGVKKKFLLDTGGGAANYISSVVADELNLIQVAGHMSFDARGIAFDRVTTVRSVVLGAVNAGYVRFGVSPGLPFDGTLSAGHFARRLLGESGADLDIDFAAMRLNVFSPDHCAGAGITWPHRTLAAVPVTLDDGHILFPVTLNGQRLMATIDTGAPWSVFNLARAERIPDFSPDATAAPPGTPPDDAARQVYFRRYAALAFEGVVIEHPLIVIRPLQFQFSRWNPTGGLRTGYPSNRINQHMPDIIIGMEVLRHLHLYYAASEEKLYITPATIPPPDTHPAASQN